MRTKKARNQERIFWSTEHQKTTAVLSLLCSVLSIQATSEEPSEKTEARQKKTPVLKALLPEWRNDLWSESLEQRSRRISSIATRSKNNVHIGTYFRWNKFPRTRKICFLQ